MSTGVALGVIVPCRDEAAVIARKLANLALARWPEAARQHRLVVVDDGSLDDGPAIAREACARLFDPRSVRAEVVANTVRPGKAGAILTGLRELAQGGAPDLVVLTDADVVAEPEALRDLALAFERDPGLGLACAAQRFVEDLAADGTCRAADLGEPRAAGGLYDAWTARVRALESRVGALFSVHGQLCAWRTSLGLAPGEGIAADDLDLMLQARCAG
ncbi:MAG TPA: glycosyltransferase, partial [Planctomycetota bacterium]|nr:glycosyltransferase [Planctomycetota bacterium]